MRWWLAAPICFAMVALLSTMPVHADASVRDDLLFITRSNPVFKISEPSTARPSAVRKTHGIAALGTGLIYLYQRFVSSQGTDSCIFTPSCSQFSCLAIQQHGLLEGGLMTFDRLQRCNQLSARYYRLDEQTGKRIDPVEENSPNAK